MPATFAKQSSQKHIVNSDSYNNQISNSKKIDVNTTTITEIKNFCYDMLYLDNY